MEHKENEKPEEKLLRQEAFWVDCPRRIVVGDPSYFEEFTGERLKRLTASYTPPIFYEARVLLTEVEFSDFPGEKVCGLSVYMAPKETIETYVAGMMYEGQEVSTKEIGVDTAQYLMMVDGQSDTIHTGGTVTGDVARNTAGRLEGKDMWMVLPSIFLCQSLTHTKQ